MGCCEEEDAICQTQQCRRAEGHYQSNLGSHNTWAVPQTDRLHATVYRLLILSNIQIFWDTEFGVFFSCQL